MPRSVRAGEVAHLCGSIAQRLQHRVGGELVVRRADEPDLQSVAQQQLAASSAKWFGGQRLAGAELRAGTQDRDRPVAS